MILTIFFVYIKDDLPNLVPFVQFKIPENLFFHVFENVQMGQNRAKKSHIVFKSIKTFICINKSRMRGGRPLRGGWDINGKIRYIDTSKTLLLKSVHLFLKFLFS